MAGNPWVSRIYGKYNKYNVKYGGNTLAKS